MSNDGDLDRFVAAGTTPVLGIGDTTPTIEGMIDKGPGLSALLDPRSHPDEFFDDRARDLGTETTGAPVGSNDVQDSWARQQYERGALYLVFTPELAGPFWVPSHFDAALYAAGGGDLTSVLRPGVPLADGQVFVDDGQLLRCDGGNLYWWPDVGCLTLTGDVRVAIHEIVCHDETDNDQLSSSDEIYALAAVVWPEGNHAVVTQTFEGVDDGEARSPNTELYAGPPAGLSISATLVEWDFGNSEEALRVAEKVSEGGYAVFNKGLLLVPGFGAVLALGAAVIKPWIKEDLAKAVSEAFNLEDDPLGTRNVTWTPKEMIVAAATEGPVDTTRVLGRLHYTRLGSNYDVVIGIAAL